MKYHNTRSIIGIGLFVKERANLAKFVRMEIFAKRWDLERWSH